LSIVFFMGVLAGEEPIDHLQKAILREGEAMHPLLQRIMQIHIAEEARHISFAHEYLKRNVPKVGRVRKAVLSVTFPVIMRLLGDAIMVPGKEMTKQVGVPRKVLEETFWDSPEARAMLSDVFYDVRALAEELELMNPVSRRVWKALKIDGAGARYRSEPVKPSARKVARKAA
ncbi:MAG: diiron oxygenase, partial [Marmoricola sp.]